MIDKYLNIYLYLLIFCFKRTLLQLFIISRVSVYLYIHPYFGHSTLTWFEDIYLTDEKIQLRNQDLKSRQGKFDKRALHNLNPMIYKL